MEKHQNCIFEDIQLKTIYSAETNYFVKPFWEFMYRIQAIYHHWQRSTNFYINYPLNFKIVEKVNEKQQENYDLNTEDNLFECDYMTHQIRVYTVVMLIHLLENLLLDLNEDLAKEHNTISDSPDLQKSLIEKYIYRINKVCGLQIGMSTQLRANLELAQRIKNRFMLHFNNDLPMHVSDKLMHGNDPSKSLIDDTFLKQSFKLITDLVKNIELSFIEYDKKTHVKKMMDKLYIPDWGR
jgi:hypothetical protein